MLFLTRSIEQFGSGFKRIDRLCKYAKIKYSYERSENGFKFIIFRPQIESVTSNVTSDVTSTIALDTSLNGTEKAVLAILKIKPDSSREEIADNVSKTVRTVQRALDSLRDKGYIRRAGAKQYKTWEVLR